MDNNRFLEENERNEMWTKSVAFCPQMGTLAVDAVSRIISQKIFSAGANFTSLLQQRYSKMSRNFRNVPHTDEKWTQKVGHEVCGTIQCACKPDARLAVRVQLISSQSESIAELYDEPNFGLDLPVWFYNGNCRKNMKRVMFVAQDPLRTDPREGFLYISSPWAFHSSDFRCSERNSIPSLLVDYLLSQGHCLYLTDAYKIFAGDHDFARTRIQSNFHDVFQEVLRDEIRLFMPNVIVAVGESASRNVLALGGNTLIGNWANEVIPHPKVEGLNINGKVIPCINAFHFSRISSQRSRLAECSEYAFEQGIGNRNYVQYYAQAIESALGEN